MNRSRVTIEQTTEEKSITISMVTNDGDANINGALHGGVMYWLCDESVGIYVTKVLGRVGAASEGSIHYYRPAKAGEKITATLRERKMGKMLGIFQVELKNEAGVLIADAMFTAAFKI